MIDKGILGEAEREQQETKGRNKAIEIALYLEELKNERSTVLAQKCNGKPFRLRRRGRCLRGDMSITRIQDSKNIDILLEGWNFISVVRHEERINEKRNRKIISYIFITVGV